MAITREDGKWRIDIRPAGRTGKRIRKLFETKAEATRFAAWVKTQYTQKPDWEPPPKENRTLLHLVKAWHDSHGSQLKDGKKRLATLTTTIKTLGNPKAVDFTAERFAEYRTRRIAQGIKANTLNHEHAYLRAMFNELQRLGQWKPENPLRRMRQMKIDEPELTYLKKDQIRAVLAELEHGKSTDAATVTRICLATGARWSEAESLRQEQISPAGITFTCTKSGKNRTVPISDSLKVSLPNGRSGRLFQGCYGAFRHAIKRTGITLPNGQMTHVLRHTFASHFMMNGGNILVLQRILGHQSLTMTMRYAHFAPNHLEAAKTLNPLDSL